METTKDTYATSDPALLQIMGHYLQQVRLSQNKTQQAIAEAAGINRTTLVFLEKGKGGTMLTFVQVLRALKQLHLLEHFSYNTEPSPLMLAEQAAKYRKRARHKPDTTTPKSTW